MRELYLFIKAHIEANLPEFKTVRLWRNQYNRSNIDRDENAFRYPSCFIEFVTEAYDNQAIGYRDVSLIVRFHMGFQSYWLEKDDNFTIMSDFDRVMFRFRGNEDDPVNFTSFQKGLTYDEPDGSNVDLQIVEYRTIFRELSSYDPGVEVAPVDLDLTAELLPEKPDGGLDEILDNQIV